MAGSLLVLVAVGVLVSGCITDTDLPDPGVDLVIDFVSIDVGAFHACGLDDSRLAYCWGGNALGQLGAGNQDDQVRPAQVVQGDTQFVQIFGGGTHTCAISGSNALYCWGSNTEGQIGLGSRGGFFPKPNKIVSTESWFSGAVGDLHTCGLTSDRRAYCWGSAELGQLGNGISGVQEFRGSPQEVLGGFNFEMITAGGAHTCALTLSDQAYCWGNGADGQLGNGLTENRSAPDSVIGGLSFQQIDGGGKHTCAVTVDGEAYCWGSNDNGQLGTGDNSDKSEPTLVSGGLSWATVSAGGSHTCGLTTGGDAYCWGGNSSGELGDGTQINRKVPTAVAGNIRFASVLAGSAPFTTASCGRATDGIVYCWGFGGSGQVGDGDIQGSLVPVRVANQGSGRGGVPTP
jgi:alpha-tubulin suppressor-like RCC1 family protein